jgi:PleD family two-component response regulator
MSRVLLADDSPNAQRMGERILREEGFEVVTVTDGETAFIRLADVDPDVILADAYLPSRSGFELCRYVKSQSHLKHIGVVLTAGILEEFREADAIAAGADAVLRKPFEASVLVATIKPLIDTAQFAKGLFGEHIEQQKVAVAEAVAQEREKSAEIDPERVRAAITIALNQAFPKMVDEITERVLVALGH